MSYIAKDAASYLTKTVGTGQCVPFVQAASGAPVSTMWKKGAAVKGIVVMDQWIGQPVHERPIRFNNPSGKIVNQGESYHVVD